MADIPVKVIINAVNNASKEFKNLAGDLDKAGLDMKKLALTGAALGTTVGLLAKDWIQQAGAMEQNEVAFKTMLGSAEKAQDLLSQIRDFAKATPFNFPELVEGSKRLLAYNVEAGDLIPTLSTLGDITAGVGRDKLPQLILAFGQVKAATKLTGAELRQFSEAGVPLLQTLADNMGMTAGEVQELVANGKVGFKDVEKALQTLTGEGGKFHNLMQEQSKTTLGKISNLEDGVLKLKTALGKALLPALNQNVDKIIPLVEQFGKWAEQNPKVVTAFTAVGLAIGAVSAAILVLTPIFKAAASVIGVLGATIGGIALGSWAAILAGLAVVAYMFFDSFRDGYEVIRANWDGITKTFDSAKQAIGKFFSDVGTIASQLWQGLKDTFIAVGDFFAGIPEMIVQMWNGVLAFFASLPGKFMELAVAVVEVFRWWYMEAIPFAIGFAVGVIEKFFTETIPAAWNAMVVFFTETIPVFALQLYTWFVEMTVMIAQNVWEFATVTIPAAISSMIEWIRINIPLMVEAFVNWIKDMGIRVWHAVGDMKTAVISTIISLKDGAIQKAKEIYQGFWDWINSMVKDSTKTANELPGNITQAMQRVLEAAVGKAKEIYEGVKEWFDKIVGFFKEIISKAGEAANKAGEAFQAGRDIGKRQFGGPVSAASPVLVGEAGPEIMVPQVASNIIPNGQGGGRGGGGPNIQFIINADMIINSPTERRNLAEALFKDLVTVARSQNLSVVEILEGRS